MLRLVMVVVVIVFLFAVFPLCMRFKAQERGKGRMSEEETMSPARERQGNVAGSHPCPSESDTEHIM